jgi:hypothetical protein
VRSRVSAPSICSHAPAGPAHALPHSVSRTRSHSTAHESWDLSIHPSEARAGAWCARIHFKVFALGRVSTVTIFCAFAVSVRTISQAAGEMPSVMLAAASTPGSAKSPPDQWKTPV